MPRPKLLCCTVCRPIGEKKLPMKSWMGRSHAFLTKPKIAFTCRRRSYWLCCHCEEGFRPTKQSRMERFARPQGPLDPRKCINPQTLGFDKGVSKVLQ